MRRTVSHICLRPLSAHPEPLNVRGPSQHEQPLRSATQCRQVKSVGSEMIKLLETASGPTATETGKYASAAVATLAALLETEKTTIPTPMRDVLDAAGALI